MHGTSRLVTILPNLEGFKFSLQYQYLFPFPTLPPRAAALPFFGMMMMVRLPAVFVICILAVPLLPVRGSEPPSTPVPTVGVTAASHLVGSGGHSYLDVRTEEEFKKGHVENSLNVPFLFFTPQGKEKNTKFIEQVALHYDKEENIIVGCLSGVRSELASADLIAAVCPGHTQKRCSHKVRNSICFLAAATIL